MRCLRGTLVLAASLAAGPGHAGPYDAKTAPNASSPTLAIAALDRQIAELTATETANKAELAELGPKIAEAHERVLVRGKGFYKLTHAGMLPVGGGFDALVSHAMRVERARRSLANDITAERALRERGADLARSLERVAKDKVSLGSQRTTIDSARVAQEDDARRAQAFDRAFATSTGTSEYVAVYSGASADLPGPGGGFAASKGRLLFPVPGRAEARPARREGTGGPGLEIRATIGSPVRAVFQGRIAFADRYGPYGRLVIVDHGDHYYTVSGNLAGIDVKVGDEVGAGDRIGSVGDDGHGAMLYFEVRKGTDTVAPGVWLGI
jgi:septal ring factor EnvC (AmiA/AmiB activator)